MRITRGHARNIKRLLAKGELSHRQIALQIGCSSATVTQISTGRWKLSPRKPKRKAPQPRKSRKRGEVWGYCKDCSIDVRLPCLVCFLRTHAHQRVYLHAEPVLMCLELQEGEEERYKAILVARQLLASTLRASPEEQKKALVEVYAMFPEGVASAIEHKMIPFGKGSTYERPSIDDNLDALPRHHGYHVGSDDDFGVDS